MVYETGIVGRVTERLDLNVYNIDFLTILENSPQLYEQLFRKRPIYSVTHSTEGAIK